MKQNAFSDEMCDMPVLLRWETRLIAPNLLVCYLLLYERHEDRTSCRITVLSADLLTHTTESAAAPDVTDSVDEAGRLFSQLVDGLVTPVSLCETVEDWLASRDTVY